MKKKKCFASMDECQSTSTVEGTVLTAAARKAVVFPAPEGPAKIIAPPPLFMPCDAKTPDELAWRCSSSTVDTDPDNDNDNDKRRRD